MLNQLWLSFFVLSFIACLYQFFLLGNGDIFSTMVDALFAMAQTSVNIALALIGIMCLWLGFFRIAEQSNLVAILSRGLAPLFSVLMPDVPKNHPAQSAVTMNLAANMLGLDNAATPMGIKAMQELQRLNSIKHVASNAQILFLVLNTSSVTLLPVTIFMYRAQAGSAAPTDVFLPILLATSCSTLAGLLAVAWFQKIKLYHPIVLLYALGFSVLMTSLLWFLSSLDSQAISHYSSLSANAILLCFILCILLYGHFKKRPVYEDFVEGAKEGFSTAIQLIPYLVAMLCAIALMRASGVLDLIIDSIRVIVQWFNAPDEFVAALPTGLMKPFSGSGARAMMLESFEHYGVDSFVGRLSSIMQGSTETTFYVLAVYFGSVGIRHGRHAVACGLISDFAGITASIICAYWFFG